MVPLVLAVADIARSRGSLFIKLLYNAESISFHMSYVVQYGSTPLIWAARKGYTDVVNILLTAKANVDQSGMVRTHYSHLLK